MKALVIRLIQFVVALDLSWRSLSLVFTVFCLLTIPYLVPEHLLRLSTEILILALYAVSFNLLLGYSGLVSYGHGVTFAIGGYASALTLLNLQTNTYISIIAGTFVGIVAGFIFALLLARITSYYFSMLTMAIGQLTFLVANRWYDVTNGDVGLQGLARAGLIESKQNYYFFVLIVVLISLFCLNRLISSPFGFCLRALRENRKRACFIGVNVFKTQLTALTISSTFSALCGALFTLTGNSIDPGSASFVKSFEPLLCSIIGGVHSFYGPIVGAFFYKFFETVFASQIPAYWPLFMGIGFVVCTIYWPYGFLGLLQDPRQAKWLWRPFQRTTSQFQNVWFYFFEKRNRH